MANLVKSGLEGFLDGYKARNLAANKVTIDFHVEEMMRLIDKLEDDAQIQEDQESHQALEKAKKILEKNIECNDPNMYYNNSKLFGESLKTFLDYNSDLSGNANQTMRKTIYHYLNLAQKLEVDQQIVQLAREIASKFNANNA